MKQKFDRRLSFISNCFLLKRKQRMAKQCRKELRYRKFRMKFKIFSRKFTVSQSPREEDIESQSDVEFDFPSLLFHSLATSQLYK